MGTRGERGDEGTEIERGQGRREGMKRRGVKSTLEDLLHTHVHHLHLLSSLVAIYLARVQGSQRGIGYPAALV